jgi:hypothetical protein
VDANIWVFWRGRNIISNLSYNIKDLWPEVQAVPLRVLYFCLFNSIQLCFFLSSLFCQHDSKTEFYFWYIKVKAYVTFLSLCMLVNFCLPLLNLERLLAVNKPTFCERLEVLTVMMMKISLLWHDAYRLEYSYRSFVTAWCLHLQGPKGPIAPGSSVFIWQWSNIISKELYNLLNSLNPYPSSLAMSSLIFWWHILNQVLFGLHTTSYDCTTPDITNLRTHWALKETHESLTGNIWKR